jgi:hypothetical protein
VIVVSYLLRLLVPLREAPFGVVTCAVFSGVKLILKLFEASLIFIS